MLWKEDTDPPSNWFIAFLQLAVDTQGFKAHGQNAGVSLQWWRANRNSPLYVCSGEVASLRPFFLQWCGLPAASDNPPIVPKRIRGRPKGSAIPTDSGLVNVAIQLFRTGQAQSLTDAARKMSKHAHGASAEANYDRLRRKVMAEWRKQGGRENN
jgi:hypothetical protein